LAFDYYAAPTARNGLVSHTPGDAGA